MLFFEVISIIIVVKADKIMQNQLNINNSTIKPFNSFKNSAKVKKAYLNYRWHNTDVVETHTKIKAFAGSLLGVALATGFVAKKQNLKLSNPLNLFKIKYGVKEMVSISALSIIGGVLGGMIGSDKKKEKINEGVFQFMNASVPLMVVHPVTKLLDNCKNAKIKENKLIRIGATFAALFAGMKGAAVLSNFINDPHDKVPDRKLTMKDSLANIDDAFGALAVAKIPYANNVEKVLPFIYTWCGYRAGQSN